jgi:hypothetical protein
VKGGNKKMTSAERIAKEWAALGIKAADVRRGLTTAKPFDDQVAKLTLDVIEELTKIETEQE